MLLSRLPILASTEAKKVAPKWRVSTKRPGCVLGDTTVSAEIPYSASHSARCAPLVRASDNSIKGSLSSVMQ